MMSYQRSSSHVLVLSNKDGDSKRFVTNEVSVSISDTTRLLVADRRHAFMLALARYLRRAARVA